MCKCGKYENVKMKDLMEKKVAAQTKSDITNISRQKLLFGWRKTFYIFNHFIYRVQFTG